MNPGDLRQREDGAYEVLVSMDSHGGQVWEPALTHRLRYRVICDLLPGSEPDRTAHDELLLEGWIHPDDPLPVCGESRVPPSMSRLRVVCLERKGHELPHREGGYTWE